MEGREGTEEREEAEVVGVIVGVVTGVEVPVCGKIR